MEDIIQAHSKDFALVLNSKGEKIPLHKEMTLTFENLFGTSVKVARKNGRVTCEADFPESKGICTWVFEIENERIKTIRAPIATKKASNLHSLINQCRVALNGRL